MKLSIVATLYRSSDYVYEFYRRTSAAASQITDEYEIVLVNDGSPDDSLDQAKTLADHDDRLVIVDLSRNFGHHKAMMTGLAQACGQRVFLVDSDLEESPEWLLCFADKMQTEQCDVVFGVQESRKGGLFERLSGRYFYKLFSILTDLELPPNIVVARLMSRRYVDALLRFDEREVFIAGLWYITGFSQLPVVVKKLSRGDTTYTFGRKMAQFVNAVTSFSNAPLIGIFYFGLSTFFIACIYTSYLVFNRIFWAHPLTGWTSVMASIWLLGGLVISFIGVVGVYLSKIFSETKRRPNTIIREVYRRTIE